MTKESNRYCVTQEHMTPFGAIIQHFARHESLLQDIVAKLTNADPGLIMVLMTGLSYRGKKDALTSLFTLIDIKAHHRKAVREYIDAMHKRSVLRNAIAHSLWIEGRRPRSIKPLGIIVWGGSGRTVGGDDNEQDYTPEELAKIADELALLIDRFTEYSAREGLR